MQQVTASLGPQDIRRIRRAYALAREALGDDIDIIVHCHCELDTPSAIAVAEAVEAIEPLYYEDPLQPAFGENRLALRRSTRMPIMTGENLELAEQALPFLTHQAVDILQPDIVNGGGITGVKAMADKAKDNAQKFVLVQRWFRQDLDETPAPALPPGSLPAREFTPPDALENLEVKTGDEGKAAVAKFSAPVFSATRVTVSDVAAVAAAK